MKLILCTLAFLQALAIHAQATFEKGYLITNKGDTLKGVIKVDPKDEMDMYYKVNFKDDKGVQKNYKPEKIREYGYGNNVFVTMEADGEKRFYRQLVKGPICFYKQLTEGIHMNKVVEENDYYVKHPGAKGLVNVKKNKFKKQITEWMKDNPEIPGGYDEEKKFDEEGAIDVIRRYNEWKLKS